MGRHTRAMPEPDASTWSARLRAQLLTDPSPTDPATVVRHLLAVQAQDTRAMRLAIRSRSLGLTAADVDRALTEDRTLVVTWLNRGTLHLVASDDHGWLHQLTAPRQLTWNRTRLAQEGVSDHQAERGVELVADAVAQGPRTRRDLRAVLDDAGIPTARQALVLVLIAASLAGEVVRGPVVDGELAYASTTAWLGPRPAPLDPAEALARLAHRYLAAHAPATPEDLARWAGLTLTQARAGFAALDDLPGPPPDDPPVWPTPRLLGGFDPILHGWTDRSFVTGPHRSIITTNGLFRPIALVEGRAAATWRLSGGRLTLDPLEPIDAGTRTALDADADAVLAYLGLTGLNTPPSAA
jgi:hypothetical protein